MNRRRELHVISFGDLMLPLVGLVAIGLLAVAGKIFFFPEARAESRPIPAAVSLPVKPSASLKKPLNTPRADKGASAAQAAAPAQLAARPQTAPQAVSPDNAVTVVAVPVSVKQDSESPDDVIQEIIIASRPPSNTETSRTTARPAPKPALSRPSAVKPSKPVQRAEPAAAKTASWLVQVGAYSTKDSADSVVKALGKSGYAASVQPAGKTLHKVLVQAGSTKQEAANVAARLERAGYPDAFVVAPKS